MKINIFYDKNKTGQVSKTQTGIFFRYYDKSNYYVIRFNIPSREGIELFKKVGGEEHLLSKFIIIRIERG